MLYPALIPIPTEIPSAPLALIGEELHPTTDGPHTIEHIVSLCRDVPRIKEPHVRKIIHRFHPDEDHIRITKAEEWIAITVEEKLDICGEIRWGLNNVIKGPFIMARLEEGEIFPWQNKQLAKAVLEFMMERQHYWNVRHEKMKAEDMPLHESLDDLIRSLK